MNFGRIQMKIMKINENEDLLELKIDIQQVENNVAFQEIALLVDKPQFLRLLPQLRKEYGIEKLLDRKEYWDKYDEIYQKGEEGGEEGKINFSKYENSDYFIELGKKNDLIPSYENIREKMNIFWMIETELQFICFYFRRPRNFKDAIKEAIFCGQVDNFQTGFVSIEDIDTVSFSTFSLPYVSMVITPATTYKDIKEMFWFAQDLYKTDKRLAYYKPRVDTVNNIRKYRYFYWKRLEGLKLEKIADDWAESRLPEEDNTTYIDVIKGIKTYKKLLEI